MAKRSRFVWISLWICCSLYGQEYLWEGGVMGGVSYYMGDMNKLRYFQNLKPMGGVLFRYTPTLRSAIKGTLSCAGLKGDLTTTSERYPSELEGRFSSTLVELGGMYEFNFFNYGDAAAYLHPQRCSPYLTAGLGVVVGFTKGSSNVVSAVLPLGVGVKYKLLPRVNIGVEVSFRWAFTDRLDGSQWANPYKIETSGLKNKDFYTFTSIFATYNFHKRKQVCNGLLGEN